MGLSRSPGSKSVEHESLQGPYRQWAPRKMRSERRTRTEGGGGGGAWSGGQMDAIKKISQTSCRVQVLCILGVCVNSAGQMARRGRRARVLASAFKVFLRAFV